ncbi:Proteasome subunit alpha type-4 [Platanthera guangdongensis]|uniref:Proteasome subunit alpha type-4 n=1 Tax=Platanthera guangdongensis TaxID=2320717 RepID=A0ABR2LBS9_9ASPA
MCILATDGVVLVGEKKVTSKLLQTSKSTKKTYKIDNHLACAVAGIMSDTNILINTARVRAQRYIFAYQEPVPVEQLVQSLCEPNRDTPSSEDSAPLASPSSLPAGTQTLASSST